MGLRKALAYSKKRARPYTRKSKDKSKAYIKVVPANKIVKYNIGNQRAFEEGKFKFILKFVSEEKIQIRDHALESGRLVLTKILDRKAPNQYYFAVKVYPHHILRNNKTSGVAGSDRLSSGMSHSFGAIEGRAAIVNPGKEIFFVACETEQGVKSAREALRIIKSKIPCKSRIIFEKVD